jgi:RHS repeat-associated protein
VAQREGIILRYIHQDHLTGTALMTDTNGDSLGTIKYYPYGSTRSGSVPTDKKFTGQRLDETGLYYYGARYYDAGIGRFINADTIVPDPANPQVFNRYSYCLNNPLKYIDPSGNIVEFSAGGISIPTYLWESTNPLIWSAVNNYIMTAGGQSVATEIGELAMGWYTFEGAASEFASRMKESEWVFTLKWGVGDGDIAYTQKTDNMVADIVLDKAMINPTREGAKGIAWLLAHESVHAVGYTFGPTGNSRFEEALASQFQLSIGGKIGYDPRPGWRFWEYVNPTGMQMALATANRAKGIDLSQGIGSRALATDLQDAYAYIGSPYLSLDAYPDTSYWGSLQSLYNFFQQ